MKCWTSQTDHFDPCDTQRSHQSQVSMKQMLPFDKYMKGNNNFSSCVTCNILVEGDVLEPQTERLKVWCWPPWAETTPLPCFHWRPHECPSSWWEQKEVVLCSEQILSSKKTVYQVQPVTEQKINHTLTWDWRRFLSDSPWTRPCFGRLKFTSQSPKNNFWLVS